MNIREALRRVIFRPREFFVSLREQRAWVVAALILVALVVSQGLTIGLTMARGIEDDARIRLSPITLYSSKANENSSDETREIVFSSRRTSDSPGDLNGASKEETDPYVGAKSLVIGLTVILPIVYLMIKLVFDTVYFRIVGAVMKLEYGFRDWFSFSVWSRIPGEVLAMLVAFFAALVLGDRSDSHLYEVLAPAWWFATPIEGSRSLKELIFYIDVPLAWLIVLQTIGFRVWSDKSLLTSLAVVAIPIVILYGLGIWFSI